MKLSYFGLALVLALPVGIIAACTPQEAQLAQSFVQDACIDAQKTATDVQSQVKGGAAKTVADLNSYVQKACPIINGAVTVASNLLADPSSTEWLGTLTGQLQAAAAVKPADANSSS